MTDFSKLSTADLLFQLDGVSTYIGNDCEEDEVASAFVTEAASRLRELTTWKPAGESPEEEGVYLRAYFPDRTYVKPVIHDCFFAKSPHAHGWIDGGVTCGWRELPEWREEGREIGWSY